MDQRPRRLVVGISGASGAIYGIRLLEHLRERGGIETHLAVSQAAAATIRSETDYRMADVERLADVVHRPRNIGASIASGSFETMGMIIAPCSIKTLSAVANCHSGDLLSRAADVTLKEGRPLLLAVRESPLHLGHLRVMEQAAAAGAIIAPPVPAFYNRPRDLDELVSHSVLRMLDRVGLRQAGAREWPGLGEEEAPD